MSCHPGSSCIAYSPVEYCLPLYPRTAAGGGPPPLSGGGCGRQLSMPAPALNRGLRWHEAIAAASPVVEGLKHPPSSRRPPPAAANVTSSGRRPLPP